MPRPNISPDLLPPNAGKKAGFFNQPTPASVLGSPLNDALTPGTGEYWPKYEDARTWYNKHYSDPIEADRMFGEYAKKQHDKIFSDLMAQPGTMAGSISPTPTSPIGTPQPISTVTPTGTTTQLPTQYFNNPTDFWNWVSKNTPLTPSNLPGIPGPPTIPTVSPATPAAMPSLQPLAPFQLPRAAGGQYGNQPASTVPAASGPEALAQRNYPQSNVGSSSLFKLPNYYNLPKLPSLDLGEERNRRNAFNPFPKYRA